MICAESLKKYKVYYEMCTLTQKVARNILIFIEQPIAQMKNKGNKVF